MKKKQMHSAAMKKTEQVPNVLFQNKQRENEDRTCIEEQAFKKFCESTVLLDETMNVKRALVWKLDYSSKGDDREVVQNMSKEEINDIVRKYPPIPSCLI